MWPSLESANRISDFANWGLVASLVVGVISTVLIVWMASTKEGYWDRERDAARERIAGLVKDTERLSGDAEAAKAEIATAQNNAATANERAAAANERAAALEKEATQARLEQERLKGLVNWRVIDPAKISALASALRQSTGTVTLRYVATDAEAVGVAVQISKALEEANRLAGRQVWTYTPDPHVYSNRLVFLIHIPDLNTNDSRAVRAAFSVAHIEYLSDDIVESQSGAMVGGVTFGAMGDRPNALIIIGSKAPPF